jgi:hypothetical protein
MSSEVDNSNKESAQNGRTALFSNRMYFPSIIHHIYPTQITLNLIDCATGYR